MNRSSHASSSSGARQSRLSDVAQVAGVSAQTVSNVLNNRTGFSEATRERVLAVAARMQFTPNRAARQLRTRRSHQLGLHVTRDNLSVRNSFTISFLGELVEAVERVDNQLVVFTHPLDEDTVEASLMASGLDGLVLCNVDDDDPRPRLLARLGVPFSLLGRTAPDLPQAWVDIDNAAAMGQVVDHLVSRGHRRIGYVGYSDPEYWNVDRLNGTRAAAARHGLDFRQSDTILGGFERLPDMVRPLLVQPERPDALICSSDSIAVIVHGLAHRAGLTPGVDVAITGFDGLPLPMELDPPLTSVAFPLAEAAAAVTRLLLDQVSGRPVADQGTLLPTRFVVGGSA